ncbi:MAG TPA: phosphonate ABC transporter ATP-binding protein [Rubrivivax sp.]|nr:phosphonate ABC transporter ATP-binding protein [Rubrivivax sp.]
MTEPAQLRVESLEVTFAHSTRALQRTTLAFANAGFTVLLGASGAGKSTLLRCLNGLVRPSAGRVMAPGVGDIAHSAALRLHRRQTGMVFQQHHLIGRLSVLDNVLTGRLGFHATWATLRPWSRAERALALAAIDRVGLLEQALRRADQLSGGQQQRVGVARALVQAPRILLADEPIASLDPATAERLLTMLHGICKSDGLTAVVSLHQLEFARQFADRIVGLRHGAVIFDGPPAALTDHIADQLYSGQQAVPSPAQLPSGPAHALIQPSGVFT